MAVVANEPEHSVAQYRNLDKAENDKQVRAASLERKLTIWALSFHFPLQSVKNHWGFYDPPCKPGAPATGKIR